MTFGSLTSPIFEFLIIMMVLISPDRQAETMHVVTIEWVSCSVCG
jgi:hypothetical protein